MENMEGMFQREPQGHSQEEICACALNAVRIFENGDLQEGDMVVWDLERKKFVFGNKDDGEKGKAAYCGKHLSGDTEEEIESSLERINDALLPHHKTVEVLGKDGTEIVLSVKAVSQEKSA